MEKWWRKLLMGFLLGWGCLGAAGVFAQADLGDVGGQVARFWESVNAELAGYEQQLDRWRSDGTAYNSLAIYYGIDDLELLMRDVRGDALQLEARHDEDWGPVRSRIARKIGEVRKDFAYLNSLLQTPPRALAE